MGLSPGQEAALLRIIQSDAKYIIGIDEVGYGACAGPIVVGGVVFSKGWGHPDITDSKKISERKRKKLLVTIIEPGALFKTTSEMPSTRVDKLGAGKALQELTVQVARSCASLYPDSIVVLDGDDLAWVHAESILKMAKEVVALTKADLLVPAVGAASIFAKVFRDRKMEALDKKHPDYGWKKNKGYGTEAHMKAIQEVGTCGYHRRSYRNVKRAMELRLAALTW